MSGKTIVFLFFVKMWEDGRRKEYRFTADNRYVKIQKDSAGMRRISGGWDAVLCREKGKKPEEHI